MANYTVGNLELTITTISSDAIKALDAVIERLKTINKLLPKLSSVSKKTGGKSTNKTSGTKKNKNETDDDTSTKKKAKKTTQEIDKKTSQINDKRNRSFFNIGKLTAALYLFRRIGRVAGEIVQAGADYAETLNLWQTSMGDNVQLASEFVKKMNEAYGISEKTLMNAQAIFKNMIGSLGQISSDTAYQLSEGIVQMALDYSSLYNVTFDQAFKKFQAALAGQVRPIRSVSGYDITETTLFQLYQSLGGTKAMRQLTRTEKQLLSIYAIFQQMERSGAVGDLEKTMESYANQSRVMAESWQSVKTYSGVLLTNIIQKSGGLQYLNALLIFISEVLKALIAQYDAIQSMGDPFETTTDGALSAGEAIDQVKGKLLDFDKFRALNSAEEAGGDIGLDDKLLAALSNYKTILGDASMKARELAENMMLATFWTRDDNGELVFVEWKWNIFAETLKTVATFLGVLIGIKIGAWLIKLAKAITTVSIAGAKLNTLLLAGAITAFIVLVRLLEKAATALGFSDKAARVIAFTIGTTLVGALLLFRTTVIDGKRYLDLFGRTLNGTFIMPLMAVGVLVAGISALVDAWGKLGNTAKILIPTLSALAGVITSLALGFTLMKGNWVGAISIGAMVAGAGLLVGSKLAAQKYADGGMPDKGTMFIAGEAGAEMVYNTPSGQSGVANIQQIAQANYSGTMRALNDWWGGRNARNDIPQLEEASATGMYQAVTGVAKSYGNKWDKY